MTPDPAPSDPPREKMLPLSAALVSMDTTDGATFRSADFNADPSTETGVAFDEPFPLGTLPGTFASCKPGDAGAAAATVVLDEVDSRVANTAPTETAPLSNEPIRPPTNAGLIHDPFGGGDADGRDELPGSTGPPPLPNPGKDVAPDHVGDGADGADGAGGIGLGDMGGEVEDMGAASGGASETAEYAAGCAKFGYAGSARVCHCGEKSGNNSAVGSASAVFTSVTSVITVGSG